MDKVEIKNPEPIKRLISIRESQLERAHMWWGYFQQLHSINEFPEDVYRIIQARISSRIHYFESSIKRHKQLID